MAYKSTPITKKASSACKLNAALVTGAGDIGASKKFKDYGKTIGDPIEDRKKTTVEKIDAVEPDADTNTDTNTDTTTPPTP